MPVERTHAFSSGVIFPLKPAVSRPILLRLPLLILRRIAYWLDYARIQLVADQFRKGAIIGKGCMIGPHAWCRNVGQNSIIRLSDNVICRGALCIEKGSVGARLTVGENVYIGDNCILSCMQCIEIGKLSMLAHGVQVFDNDSHPLDATSREQDYLSLTGRQPDPRQPIATDPIVIGNRCWIGFNSAIMKGVILGEGVVVAAMSVVTNNVPAWTLVGGNPARIIKEVPH